MATVRAIAAGTQEAWLAFTGGGNYNYLLGGDNEAPAAGTASHALRLVGVQTFPTGIPEGESVSILGDDTTLGAIIFDSDTPTELVASFGVFDLDLMAKVQGTKVETIGSVSLGVVRPAAFDPPNAALIIQGKALSYDPGTSGQARWYGFIYPIAQVQSLNRESFEGRTAASNRFRITAQLATHKNWGVTIADAELGTDGAYALPFISDNPLTMTRFTGNGSETVFPLLQTPISAARTYVFVDRVQSTATTDYTVSVANKTLTFTSPPANGAVVVVLYEYAV